MRQKTLGALAADLAKIHRVPAWQQCRVRAGDPACRWQLCTCISKCINILAEGLRSLLCSDTLLTASDGTRAHCLLAVTVHAALMMV